MHETKETGRPAPAARGFGGALWSFFSSVKLAIITLIIIAAISIIGTILAQGDSREDNVKIFESMIVKVFDVAGAVDPADPASMAAQHERIHAAAERLYHLSQRLGFTDLYSAWYFYLILGVFSTNLVVCSIKRWPVTWRMIARPRLEQEESYFSRSSQRFSVAVRRGRGEARDAVAAVLKKAGFSPRQASREDAVFLFGQRGVVGRLGVYFTHLSILVILVGGIVGKQAGFKGWMQITEKTATDRVMERRSRAIRKFPFQVRCDNFEVQYYEGSMRPKDYYSDLTILQDGKEMVSKRIEVNSPLVYDGIYFYQSSFGETGRGLKVRIRVADPAGEKSEEVWLERGPVEVAGFGLTLSLDQYLPDFAMDPQRGPYSQSAQANNPAARVKAVFANGTRRDIWLLQRYPELETAKGLPVKLTLAGIDSLQYTGLQVVYDPGVWIIWVGCGLMVIGLFCAFFIPHRRVWVRIDGAGPEVTVRLAGNASKNRDAFAEDFTALGGKISEAFGEKRQQ